MGALFNPHVCTLFEADQLLDLYLNLSHRDAVYHFSLPSEVETHKLSFPVFHFMRTYIFSPTCLGMPPWPNLRLVVFLPLRSAPLFPPLY